MLTNKYENCGYLSNNAFLRWGARLHSVAEVLLSNLGEVIRTGMFSLTLHLAVSSVASDRFVMMSKQTAYGGTNKAGSFSRRAFLKKAFVNSRSYYTSKFPVQRHILRTICL